MRGGWARGRTRPVSDLDHDDFGDDFGGTIINRYGPWALGLIALLAVIANFIFDYSASAPAQLGPRPRDIAAQVDRLAGAAMFQERIGDLSKSVFQVHRITTTPSGQKRTITGGTAFLVDRACGIFATNAHVAERFIPGAADTGPREGFLHNGRSDSPVLPIVKVELHPGYQGLEAYFDRTGPIIEERGAGKSSEAKLRSPRFQFDVALLYTKPVDDRAACKADDTLPPALELATDTDVRALRSGNAIAILGFPGTGHVSEDARFVTIGARADFGSIRAVGTLLPNFAAGAAPSEVLDAFIFHSTLSIAGSSGSPVLSQAGRVIGIEFQGRADLKENGLYTEGNSAPVILLKELLDGTAEKSWEATLAAIDGRVRFKTADAGTKPSSTFITIDEVLRHESRRLVDQLEARYGMIPTNREGSLSLAGPITDEKSCDLADSVCLDAQSDMMAARLIATEVVFHDIEADFSKINLITAMDYDPDVEEQPPASNALERLYSQNFQNETYADFACPVTIAHVKNNPDTGKPEVVSKGNFDLISSVVLPISGTGVKKVRLAVVRSENCSGKYSRVHVLVTPFDLEKPKPEQTSFLEGVGEAFSQSDTSNNRD
ncbi:MAG TPA: hypothetical protein DCL48_09180, partial [Alphaproteobacteria bacterium]|nr:hypothetical protein [Alphaproteobacteria bacterium]